MPRYNQFFVHETADPRIFLAGGDFFGEECLSRFDGLLGFVHGGFSPLNYNARKAFSEGLIKSPYILHGVDPIDRKPSIKILPSIIRDDLKNLTSQGCRKIGFIGAETNVSYAESAKECIRTIVKWMDRHPDALDSVTFVVDDDDYYRRFGRDPFRTGTIIYNPNPSDFERWFEESFLDELKEWFQVDKKSWYPFMADSIILCDENCPLTPENNLMSMNILFLPDTKFSVALFYMVLIPQVIAKTTGNIDGISAFAKCSGWPVVHRFMSGHISPYAVLKETGLLPDSGSVDLWVHLAEEEKHYFTSIVNTLISGRIFVPTTPESSFLSALNNRFKGEICDNLSSYVKAMIAYLRGDGPEPEMDYVREEDLVSD